MRRHAAIALIVILVSGTLASAQGICDSIGCSDNGPSSSANGSGSASDFECGGDTWTLSGSVLWLARKNFTAEISRLLGDTGFDPIPYDFGYQAGYEIGLDLHLDSERRFATRWFDANWRQVETRQRNLTVGTFSHDSYLQSFEVVHRTQWLNCFNPSLGVRYVEYGESALQNIDLPILDNFAALTVTNSMFGAQFGADGDLWCAESLSIGYFTNLAVFGNYAHLNSARWDIGAGPNTTPTIKDEVGVFLAEIGLNGQVQLTRCLSIRGGYRCLWLDGVVSTRDLDFSGLPNVELRNETAFFHGADLGLELALSLIHI